MPITKLDDRQMVNRSALSISIGSSANDQLDTIFALIDSKMVTLTGTQTLTNKTLAFLKTNVATDSTSTGASATLAAGDIVVGTVRLTNASLTSISGIPAGSAGQFLVIENKTGAPITINNDDAGATAANRILTGVGNVTLANDATFAFTYDAVSSRWMLTGGSGSGSGSSINYITTFNAEAGTTGWALYNNAAQNIPNSSVSNSGGGTAGSGTKAFGAGGGVNNLTFASSAIAPLMGTNSFLLTHSAANAQGEGVSFPFTIDPAYQANVLGISFSYNASASMTVSDGVTTPLNDGTTATNAGNSDVEVFIVDVTNNVLIPVNPEVLTSKGANNFTFNGSFQTSSNSTSYILAFHVATASTTAWTFKFDNVVVGPQNTVQGIIPKAETIQKFLTGSGTYTTPSNVLYIKVKMVGGGGGGAGSTAGGTGGTAGTGGNTTFGTTLLSANGGVGGAAGGGTGGAGGSASLGTGPAGIALTGGTGDPSSFSQIATVVTLGGSGATSPFGGQGGGSENGTGGAAVSNTGSGGGGAGTSGTNAQAGAGGGAGGFVDAVITSPSATYAYAVGAAGTGGTAGAGGFAGGAGGSGVIVVEEFYSGTNFSMASGANTGTGDVAARYSNTASPSYTNGTVNIVDFSTKTYDSLNAVTTGASWKFTAPSSGKYVVKSALVFNSGASWVIGEFVELYLYKNGSYVSSLGEYYAQATHSTFVSVNGSDTIQLIAGDYIDIRVIQQSGGNAALSAGVGYNFVAIERISSGSGTVAFGRQAPTIQKFLTGSGTYTTPANALYVKVRMVGGGGGGAGSGTATGTVATAGGNTTFGTTLLVANGGSRGEYATNSGAGGTASLGTGPVGQAVQGGTGQGGGMTASQATFNGPGGGNGAVGPFGGGGGGGTHGQAGLAATDNSGSGGGGGGTGVNGVNGVAGSGGSSGGFVDAIIAVPLTAYSYSVGTAGSAGGAGTDGHAGGIGGSGVIIVEEYYQ